MVFRDELLQKGEWGGRTAAKQLWNVLDSFASKSFPNVTSPKIITRVFVDVKGSSELYMKAGIINEHKVFEDFVRGFNDRIALFDFVDVGSESGKANDKIRGTPHVSCLEDVLPFVSLLSWLRPEGHLRG